MKNFGPKILLFVLSLLCIPSNARAYSYAYPLSITRDDPEDGTGEYYTIYRDFAYDYAPGVVVTQPLVYPPGSHVEIWEGVESDSWWTGGTPVQIDEQFHVEPTGDFRLTTDSWGYLVGYLRSPGFYKCYTICNASDGFLAPPDYMDYMGTTYKADPIYIDILSPTEDYLHIDAITTSTQNIYAGVPVNIQTLITSINAFSYDIYVNSQRLSSRTGDSGLNVDTWIPASAGSFAIEIDAITLQGTQYRRMLNVDVADYARPLITVVSPTNYTQQAQSANIEIACEAGSVPITNLSLVVDDLVVQQTSFGNCTFSTNLPPGRHNLYGVATDGITLTSSITNIIYVSDSTVPLVTLKLATNLITQGATLDVNAEVFPAPDNVIQSINLFCNNVVVTNWPAGNSPYVWQTVLNTAGTIDFFAVAIDTHGVAFNSSTSSVVVAAPNPITATFASPVNNSIFTNYINSPQNLSIVLTIDDPNVGVTFETVRIYDGATCVSSNSVSQLANPTDGMHVLTGVVQDNLGISITATSLVQVVTHSPPTVVWTTPTGTNAYVSSSIIPLEVAINNITDPIQCVMFFNDGSLIGTVTQPPYKLLCPYTSIFPTSEDWPYGPASSQHTITAVAKTIAGANASATTTLWPLQALDWVKITPGGSSSQETRLIPNQQHYTLPADGKTIAMGKVSTGIASFSFAGKALGCSLTTDGMLTVSTNEGTVPVLVNMGSSTELCYFNLVGSTCTACTSCRQFGSCTRELGSVNVKIGLGHSDVSGDAGYLQIHETELSANLGSPATLHYDFIRPEVTCRYDAFGSLKQINTLDGLINCVINDTNTYTLNFYPSSQVGACIENVYQFFGAPEKTIQVSFDATQSLLSIFDSSGNQTTTYQFNNGNWVMSKADGFEVETQSVSGSQTTIMKQIQASNGETLTVQTEIWQDFPNGRQLVEQVIGSNTNTYVYTEDGLLQEEQESTGNWHIYTYDDAGRMTGCYSPFLNSLPSTNSSACKLITYDYSTDRLENAGDDGSYPRTPRCVITYIDGNEVSRSYTILTSASREDITCTIPGATWDDTNNLVTYTTFDTSALNYGKVSMIQGSDGLTTFFDYTQLIQNGQPIEQDTETTYATDWNVAKVDISTTDINTGHLLTHTQTDGGSGLMIANESYSYDTDGHLISVHYLDGTAESFTYDCCHKLSSTDRTGVTAFYGYDNYNRLIATTQDGVTQLNDLDSADRVWRTHRIGKDASNLVTSQSTYDTASELVSMQDALGHSTSYSNYVDVTGQQVKLTTQGDLITIEQYARDGSLVSHYGNAGPASRADYGIALNNGVYQCYKKTIKLNKDGTDSIEWSQSFQDAAGRTVTVVYPDGANANWVFNSSGQLIRQVDPDGIMTLYSYDPQGRLEFQAVDVNHNGTIDFAGNDQITHTVHDVWLQGTNVVNRTCMFTYPTATPVLVGFSEQAVDAQKTWQYGINGTNYTEVTLNGNVAVNTTLGADGVIDVTSSKAGKTLSHIIEDEAGTILQQSYVYDEFNRPSQSIDARDGITGYTYNNADQIVSVSSPAPGDGSSAQTTINYYDYYGNVVLQRMPDETWVTNVYNPDKTLQMTSGSRRYPVAYTYDYAGRLQTLTTWDASGPAVTTWYYNNRGQLVSKAYNDGNGPSYTYTPGGRLSTKTQARGIVTTYGYNGSGSLQSVNYSDSTPNVTLSYNRLGQVSAVNGAMSSSLQYTSQGQLIDEDMSGPNYISQMQYGFDGLNRLNSINSTTLGNQTTIGYTGGRITTISTGPLQAQYGYVPNSALLTGIIISGPNGTISASSRQYDALNRLQSIASCPSIFSVGYAFNTANQRTARTNADASVWNYGYDSLGQVTDANKVLQNGQFVAGQQFQFGYDTIGNRTYTRNGGYPNGTGLHQANYSVNALNQYTSRDIPGFASTSGNLDTNALVWVNGVSPTFQGDYFWQEFLVNNMVAGVLTNLEIVTIDSTSTNVADEPCFVPQTPEHFHYDPDGDRLQDAQWVYKWDAECRLVGMTNLASVPAPLTLGYSYDYQGRRITKTVMQNGTLTSSRQFHYDGWNLTGEQDLVSGISITYNWGLDLSQSLQGAGGIGGLISMTVQNSANAGTYVYQYDGNGNVMGLVNTADGSIAAQYEYGPFGELLMATGPLAYINHFRFSTKYQDDETGFLYYGYRYYDPSPGTWLSRDPSGTIGGLNMYGFVDNSAVYGVDYLGLWKRDTPEWSGGFGAYKGTVTAEACDTTDGLVTLMFGNTRYAPPNRKVSAGETVDISVFLRILENDFRNAVVSETATFNAHFSPVARAGISSKEISAYFQMGLTDGDLKDQSLFSDCQSATGLIMAKGVMDVIGTATFDALGYSWNPQKLPYSSQPIPINGTQYGDGTYFRNYKDYKSREDDQVSAGRRDQVGAWQGENVIQKSHSGPGMYFGFPLGTHSAEEWYVNLKNAYVKELGKPQAEFGGYVGFVFFPDVTKIASQSFDYRKTQLN